MVADNLDTAAAFASAILSGNLLCGVLVDNAEAMAARLAGKHGGLVVLGARGLHVGVKGREDLTGLLVAVTVVAAHGIFVIAMALLMERAWTLFGIMQYVRATSHSTRMSASLP